MADSQPQPERPKPDPKALTPEYHKARKQLVLWSGILLIWALVGVDLNVAGDADGNVGTLIKAIQSKQAVPWVLVILVGYFVFKTTIEWYQCNQSRRRLLVSRVDFVSAWFISLVAFTLYFGQKISNVRLADELRFSSAVSLFWGLSAGFWIGALVLRVILLRRDRARIDLPQLTATMAGLGVYTLPAVGSYFVARIFFGIGIRWLPFLLGVAFIFVFLFGVNSSWLKRRGWLMEDA